ncbi:unnamed protein product [Peniophora sp. CBMAI 1063]|nr:unnamed protein product [Peniophora sp. CBMAI 1063]
MSEIAVYNVNPSSTKHDVSRALAGLLHNPPFSTHWPVPLNFDVVLIRPKGRSHGTHAHNGTGYVTFPTMEIGHLFLQAYGARGSGHWPQKTCTVGGRPLVFRVSRGIPDANVIRRLLRCPYQDSKALEAQEQRMHELSSQSVSVKTVQFGWDCRDGTFSVEWERDVNDKAMLWFSDENKQLRLSIRHGRGAFLVVGIRHVSINRLSAYNHGESSAVWLSLSVPPRFELERSGTGAPGTRAPPRQRLSCLPFSGHGSVAPYTALAMRLVLTSAKQLQKFKRLAGVAQLHSVHTFQVTVGRRALFSPTVLEELRLWMRHFPWRVSFQIEATVNNLLVDATEMLRLIPRIGSLMASHGSRKVASLLKLFRERVAGWWDRSDVPPSQKTLETCFGRALADYELQSSLPDPDSTADANVFYSHKVTLTATGMLLDGPFREQSNRVLRTYPREHHDCFIRVSFMDDGSVPYRFDREIDSRGFVRSRVGKALKEGLEVAGKRYHFLAYSLSALKEHTVWFVRPFVCSDRHGETIRVDAARVIASLGTFDNATRVCPARYAARISQAFTATDQAVVEVEEIVYGQDIMTPDGRYCHTDGVGTLSLELAEQIWAELQERKRTKRRIDTPRAFQVRFQGSKGMLSVDHKLRGAVIVLRPSMKKFDAPDEPYVEIARAFDGPNAYFLNRPLIMVLEGLGVSYAVFKKYQDAAVSEVKGSMREIMSTAQLFDKYGLGTSFRASSVLNNLSKLGVDHLVGDKFYDRSLVFAVNHILRDLKNHARIPVSKGYTLVGVADVHGALWGSEVYACVRNRDGTLTYLEGDVLISRSPTCHPGDVQIATAIGRPPTGSSFAREPLPNMIVFSTRGRRPLPSCLGGGDLDGDLYNIIPLKDCPEFRPQMISEPAAYDPAPRRVLNRPSTMADVADFVVDYINSDVLGLIATNWLITADQSPDHVFDSNCMILSQLHSDAVDYQKSGQAVAVDRIPRLRYSARPDWSAPETVNAASSTTHYKSRRALGRLYRRIDLPDVDPAREEHRQQQRQRRTRNLDVDDLAEGLADIALDADEDPVHLTIRQRVNSFIDTDEEAPQRVRDTVAQLFRYHAGELQGICATHVLSHRRTSTLTEEEVFVGTIIEKTSLLRKRRETMATMREHTDYLVRHIRSQLAATEEEPLSTGLRRGWAAWQLSLAEHKLFGAKTFGWVALGSIFDTMKEMEEAENDVRSIW